MVHCSKDSENIISLALQFSDKKYLTLYFKISFPNPSLAVSGAYLTVYCCIRCTSPNLTWVARQPTLHTDSKPFYRKVLTEQSFIHSGISYSQTKLWSCLAVNVTTLDIKRTNKYIITIMTSCKRGE